MLEIAITMGVIILLAATIVVYVAYPYRGQRVPKAGWLGDAMQEAVDRIPTVEHPAHAGEPAPTTDSHERVGGVHSSRR